MSPENVDAALGRQVDFERGAQLLGARLHAILHLTIHKPGNRERFVDREEELDATPTLSPTASGWCKLEERYATQPSQIARSPALCTQIGNKLDQRTKGFDLAVG